MKGWRPAGRAVAGLALLAGGLWAQTPTETAAPTPDTFGERVDVEVVNVDVIVTDKEHRRVLDLQKDEFELLVDGRPVAIEYFAPPRGSRPAAEAASVETPATLPTPPTPALTPTNLVFYVDQTALENRARHDTLAELREFLGKRAAGSERVMVAAFEQDLRVLQLPTGDRERIAQALDQLEKLPARARLGSSERIQLEQDVRAYGQFAQRLDGVRAGNFLRAEALRIESEISNWAEVEIDRERRSVAALARLVGALGAVEGRKSVVLATAGITGNPALFLRQAFDQQRRTMTSSDANRSPAIELAAQALLREFEEMIQAAQNARVAFYTVSPGAVPLAQNSAEFASAGSASDKPMPRDPGIVEASSSIRRLAGATGGASFTIGADLDRRLQGLTADADAAYSIGFSTGVEAGEKDHEIEVRSRRRGLEVRHRESFRRRSAPDRVEAALAAAVTFGQAENPLEVAIQFGAGKPLPRKKAGEIVPLAVAIPLRLLTLLAAGSERHGSISVRVAIQDARGRLLEGGAVTLPIVVAESELATALAGSWYYRAEMRLAPGPQRVAVAVLDELSGVQSTAFAELDVRAPQ